MRSWHSGPDGISEARSAASRLLPGQAFAALFGQARDCGAARLPNDPAIDALAVASPGRIEWLVADRRRKRARLSAPVLTIGGKKKILTFAKRITVKAAASDPDGDPATVRFIDSRQRGRVVRSVTVL